MPSLQHIINFVQADMNEVCTAHDFAHIQRVVRNAEKIIATENNPNINKFVALASAYLHEYFDEKFWNKDQLETRAVALDIFLAEIGITPDDHEHIIHIIKHVGYGKSLTRSNDFPYTIEFQIVEDADRLDAIGAIAIARTFAYGGKKGRSIYDPNIPIKKIENDEQYRDGNSPSLNHFWEKLLLLKDLMHTETAKKIAQSRHDYMNNFVNQFLKEWNE
ncbi:MAG TPA: HD domain-containing protein [Candidatus Absconditabacterales bacterium]|nr:HD domain-containing protein [Candidatus Absconditabacterales bacterium]